MSDKILLKKMFCGFGLLFLTLAAMPHILWFIITLLYQTHWEQKEVFTGIFNSLHLGGGTISLLSLAFSMMSVLFGIFSGRIPLRSWYIIKMLCIVIGSMLALLNLFQMM